MHYGYFWPTMQESAKAMLRACHKCQIHDNDHHVPQNEYHSMSSPVPFAQWGMELLGPFLKAKEGKEYLVVAVNYFTRWIEVKALNSITSKNIQDFFWEDIICRHGIPKILIMDNGRQFDARNFLDFYEELGIKQRFTSVAHPQTNGLAKVTNWIVLRGLKKCLES